MFQFPKKQKLSSKRAIDRLFLERKNIYEPPFIAIWNLEKNSEKISLKTLIVVPKKKIKKSVNRNSIRRKIKEAYRHKKVFLEAYLKKTDRQLNLGIIYQEEKSLDYNIVEEKINLLLTRLMKEL